MTQELSDYFSEAALMKYRVLIEIEYFIALCDIPLPQLSEFDKELYPKLRDIYKDFTEEDAKAIKEIEHKTNHDIKAVEYFIREKFNDLELTAYEGFIHFGLTSQDINNTAFPYALRKAVNEIYYPAINEVIDKLENLADKWSAIPMLARTHGQPASPTRLGKEVAVFVERFNKQLDLLKNIPFSAKFGGATGNFNAHHVAYPKIDWVKFANTFVNKTLGLNRSQTTTQIEHYDNFAALCDNLKRINNIIIDLDRDMWAYISLGYFKQIVKKDEVGSSAMPHKVNPIDFENSEGNAGMANAIFEHFAAKLPISRLQRDLTDSTVLRNVGVPLAHTLLAFKSLLKGLDKLILNKEAIEDDLENNRAVVAEAIQTILRRESYPNAYEVLKEFTRTNEQITDENLAKFIDTLNLSDDIKAELKSISPENYTGI